MERQHLPQSRHRAPRSTASALQSSGEPGVGAPASRPAPRALPRVPARPSGDEWVVLLAGGDGRRLLPHTTTTDGEPVPKQFCRFRDERTLLHASLDRARCLVPSERIVVLVREAHRRWWEGELAGLPAGNVIAQAEDRGTGVAMLQALVEIHCRDSDPLLVVMPSDADVDEEDVLLRALGAARRAARDFPSEVTLLGAEPTCIDPGYDLVVPATGRRHRPRRVAAFVDEPLLTVASRLTGAGALWNSLFFACRGWALYELFEEARPELGAAYLRSLARSGDGPAALQQAAAALPTVSFSRDVLRRSTGRLLLVRIPPCGWTEMGTTARLASWLARHRDAIFWRDHPALRPPAEGGLGGAALPA